MARSLRDQGPLPTLQDNGSPDDLLGRPEEQEFVTRGDLVPADADFERGMQQAAAGLRAGTLYRAATKAQAEGNDVRAAELIQQAEQDDKIAQSYAPRVSSYADVEGVGDAIDYVQQSFGQLAPSMAQTTIPGIIGGTAAGILTGGNPIAIAAGASFAAAPEAFSMEAGEAASSQFQDPEIAKLDPKLRLREQNIKGLGGAALELVLPGVISGRLTKSLGRVFKQIGEEGAKQAAKKGGKTLAKDVGLETFTEAATEGGQAYIGQASLSRLNPNRDTSHDVQEIIDSVIMGGLGGGGISLGTGVPGALASKATGAMPDLKIPNIGRKKAPGTVASDADLTAEAEGRAPPGSATPKRSDADLQAEAEGLDPYGPEFYGPEGPFPPGDGMGQEVTPEDVDVDEAGRARLDKELEKAAPLSDAELERRARIKKSQFGTRIPVEEPASESGPLRQAEPEEVMQLRELKPMSGKQERGQRRYVRRTEGDVKTFLKNQVDRGVISQEVADSAIVEPLGQSMKRKKASVQEMENELASIVRDIMHRIEGHKKSKEDRTDVIKALTSELENLPIDVQRRGETTTETATLVERKAEKDLEQERAKAGTRKWEKNTKQGDLFPTKESFPIPISEVRKNHFNFVVDLEQGTKQQKLDLGPGGKGETYQELLIKALDNYSTVLASDAARGESAASATSTKDARRRTDIAATPEQRAELKPIKLKKKNGQTETLDADSLMQVGIREAGGREALIGGRKNVGTQQEDEAALASALASQLLRNDVEGIVDPSNGKTVTGVEANKAIQRWIKSLKPSQRGRARRAMVNKQRRALGQYELKSSELDLLESGNRAKIQRGFKMMRNRILDDQKLNELANTGQPAPADPNVTAKQAKKLRRDLRKTLAAEVKRIRANVAAANEFIQKAREMELSDEMQKEGADFDAWYKAAKAALDPEVQQYLDSKAAKGTAKFRADRLDTLVKEIDEMEQSARENKEEADLQGELEGGRAETLEPEGVRHAEEQTGAGTQVAVGTPLRGENRQQKLTETQQQKAAKKHRRLEAQLKKMKTAAEVKPLLERALGYKPGELPLVNQERHVLLGSVAKQYLRDALSDAGVPMRSVKDVQGGDRVVILVAKSDMEKVINSKEFRTLMSKGATIFMPEGSQQFYREFMGAGYVAMPQPGTTVAWAPSVGFEGDSATRRYSKVVSLTKKQEEQRAKQQREFFDQIVGAVEDRMGPLTITKEEERQLIEEELAAFRTDTFEEKQKSISDMKDSIQMLRDSAAELRELKQEDLAQEQEGAVALMGTILKEMERILAGENVVSLFSQPEKLAETEELPFDPKSPDSIRAFVNEEFTEAALFDRLVNNDGLDRFHSTKQAKEWIAFNHAQLIEMYIRRVQQQFNPLYGIEEDFAGNRKLQAAFIKEVFGEDVAKRISLATSGEELLGEMFDITFQGEVMDPANMKGKENAGKRAVYGFMKKVAPRSASTLVMGGYFEQMAEQAKKIMRYIASGNGTLELHDWARVSQDLLTGQDLPNPISAKGKEGVNGAIEQIFGKEHVGKTLEQLLDVPMKIGASDILVHQLKNIKNAYVRKGLGRADWTDSLPYMGLAIGKNMTLRQMIDGHKFAQENMDALEINYTGDFERLAMHQGQVLEHSGGSMGVFNALDDRITLFDGALQNRFMTAFTAWHELFHRGLAVEHGAELKNVLERAGKNPTIKKMAAQLRLERTMVGDSVGRTDLGAIEEAMVELGAAIETGNFEYLTDQYGVQISENLKKPLVKLWMEFQAMMKTILGKLARLSPSGREMASDLDVLQILKDAREAALTRPPNRARSSENFNPEFKDRVRFSRETTHNAELQNAINQKTRAARQRKISEYLAKVLGDRVNVVFNDIQSNQDAAGWFDWATATISLAINTTNSEGTARHEAFHAFFHALGKLDKDRAIYERLLKAANAPHIKHQLRKLLAGHPEALKQLADPEERLAYMFQFYAMKDANGKPMINLQPQTFKKFREWAKKLARIVGYVSRHESAERIFSAFNEGHLKTDAQISEMIRTEQHQKLMKQVSPILRGTEKAMRAVLTTATDRLRHTNNTSLTRIADLYASRVKGGGMAGFLAMRGQKEGQFRNLFNEVFERHLKDMDSTQADAAIKQALEELQSMKETADLSPLAKDVRKVLRRMFMYLSDQEGGGRHAVHMPVWNEATMELEWKPIQDAGPRYFPRIWDAQAIIDNWDQFVQDMKDEGGLSEDELLAFRRRIENGDGMVEFDDDSPLTDPAMRAINQRVFKFINEGNAHKFAKYQSKDLAKILTTYSRQAAQRGESTRHFGVDNEKVKSLLAQAKEEGATPEEMKMADKAIKALNGTLGVETMTPLKKNAIMTAITVVNFAVLPLALFSSLVDPLGVAVRTGNFKAAGRTFNAGVQQIIADIKGDKTKHQKLAEFLGIVEQEQILSVMGDTYNSMFANDHIQRANTRFFKIIGLDSWTKGTRIGAMVASMEYIKEYRNDAERMAELGLEPGDIQIKADGTLEMAPGRLGMDKARRVQGAVYRMVDESILRPTAAQRPIYMSDMRFVLLGHLKQFTFSFHNTIVRQVAKNVADNVNEQEYGKAMTQLLPLISYVPFMMAADMLRAVVGGRIDDDDREPDEFLRDAIQRSGVMGVYTFGMDAADDIAYGGAPVNTMLGPVIHKGAKLAHSAIDRDHNFRREFVRLLPGYAFWKGWME